MKNRILITLTMLVCLSLLQAAAQGTDIVPTNKKGKWGYVDSNGKMVIDFKYIEADFFNIEGLAKVQTKGRKWGYIDKTGKEIVPCIYESVTDFSDGLTKVTVGAKWGYCNKTGNEVIPCKEYLVGDFSKGLAIVKLYGKWGCFDNTDIVIPCKFDEIRIDSDRLVRVILDGKWGCYDKTGKEVISCKYDAIGYFSNGLSQVKLDGKYGYIDEAGEEVIPCKYDNVGEWKDGLAYVSLKGKLGYYDKTGKEVISCKYDRIDKWDDGKAFVWIDGKIGRIDKDGNEISPLKYNSDLMQDIWENLLLSHKEQINAIIREEISKSSNEKTSGAFTIKRPYLLLSTYEDEKYKMDFSKYSEKDFSVKNVKTLAIQYNCPYRSQGYNLNQDGSGIVRASVQSYSSYIFYFNVEKMEYIGFDLLSAPDFPKSVYRSEKIFNPEILKTVESRLANPAK